MQHRKSTKHKNKKTKKTPPQKRCYPLTVSFQHAGNCRKWNIYHQSVRKARSKEGMGKLIIKNNLQSYAKIQHSCIVVWYLRGWYPFFTNIFMCKKFIDSFTCKKKPILLIGEHTGDDNMSKNLYTTAFPFLQNERLKLLSSIWCMPAWVSSAQPCDLSII